MTLCRSYNLIIAGKGWTYGRIHSNPTHTTTLHPHRESGNLNYFRVGPRGKVRDSSKFGTGSRVVEAYVAERGCSDTSHRGPPSHRDSRPQFHTPSPRGIRGQGVSRVGLSFPLSVESFKWFRDSTRNTVPGWRKNQR